MHFIPDDDDTDVPVEQSEPTSMEVIEENDSVSPSTTASDQTLAKQSADTTDEISKAAVNEEPNTAVVNEEPNTAVNEAHEVTSAAAVVKSPPKIETVEKTVEAVETVETTLKAVEPTVAAVEQTVKAVEQPAEISKTVVDTSSEKMEVDTENENVVKNVQKPTTNGASNGASNINFDTDSDTIDEVDDESFRKRKRAKIYIDWMCVNPQCTFNGKSQPEMVTTARNFVLGHFGNLLKFYSNSLPNPVHFPEMKSKFVPLTKLGPHIFPSKMSNITYFPALKKNKFVMKEL